MSANLSGCGQSSGALTPPWPGRCASSARQPMVQDSFYCCAPPNAANQLPCAQATPRLLGPDRSEAARTGFIGPQRPAGPGPAMGLGVSPAISGRAPRWPRRIPNCWPWRSKAGQRLLVWPEKRVARCLTYDLISRIIRNGSWRLPRGDLTRSRSSPGRRKEFFELCFREKCWRRPGPEMPTPRKKEKCPAGFVLAPSESEAHQEMPSTL